MCIGIPLRITSADGLAAQGERRDGTVQDIDLSLVGPQAVGTWVLAHLGAARSVLTDEEARQIDDALAAAEAVQRGENIDHLFADLIGREPTLPDHLKGRT